MYPEKKAAEKKKIIEAARSLFLKDGYDQVSMRKIAAKVGYSPTNIYNYFENKEAIVLQLLQEGYALFLHYLEEATQQHQGERLLDRIKAVLLSYVQFSLDHPEYYRLIFIQNLESENTVIVPQSDRMQGFFVLLNLVTEAIETNLFPAEQPLLISESLWAHVHGLASLLITFESFNWVDKHDLIKHHIDTHINGLCQSAKK